MEKLLTIAIPTYKRTEELKRALEALASQYDERVEILICDDASPDNTQEIIEEFQKKIPIRYIRNTENLGFDRNFIKCYRVSAGKFVLMMGNDDFIVQGGLAYILSYLEEHNDVDWTFINLAPFMGDCSYTETNLIPKKAEIEDQTHISKKEFISYVWSDITALSSIIRKESIAAISNQEKYIGTYFEHTCLWMESTKNENSVLGIIGKACIAYHYAEINSNSIWKPETYFEAFYRGYKNVFCTIGSLCGYDNEQMKKVFVNRCGGKNTILQMNANRVQGWRKAFWEIGYPVIKDVPSICFKVIPIVCLPSFVARFLVKLLPVYRKLKAMKKQAKFKREVRKQ